ncbi:unnamed protein product [Rhizoctonia solani]|uniref:Uncharacterized protein n=1 Tax=Rhizoctonia solani TaxID=456999 RepID=A0A8H3DU33_9AGAM|nr:unnamed protein product [Rhizoctonia solani]
MCPDNLSLNNMSNGSTSPKRSFRSSLKSLFDKKFHATADQSERSSHEFGSNNSTGSLSTFQQSYESKPSSLENRHNAASTTLEGTLRALRHSAEIFPPLQAAMGTLISGLEAVPASNISFPRPLYTYLTLIGRRRSSAKL